MEGIVTSLAAEVAQFGVHVTAIEPGGFHTDWSGRSMVRAPRLIADYDSLVDPIRTARADYNGRQPGDPSLAGQAILAVVDAENPPVHLLLGTDALNAVTAAQQARTTEMEDWRVLTASTDRAADNGA